MIDLSGKVAMITGSSRGIGSGCALEMARAGADICVNYHSHGDEAQQVAEEVRTIGRRAMVYGSTVFSPVGPIHLGNVNTPATSR